MWLPPLQYCWLITTLLHGDALTSHMQTLGHKDMALPDTARARGETIINQKAKRSSEVRKGKVKEETDGE